MIYLVLVRILIPLLYDDSQHSTPTRRGRVIHEINLIIKANHEKQS